MAQGPGDPEESARTSSLNRSTFFERVERAIFGKPLDPSDSHQATQLLLVPILAWIGLGADALSSSAYGPEEAFKVLAHGHTYLAVLLAIATAVTVLVISAAYSRIIEHFPHGGGGYVVASRLLGDRVGVVSGSALLVDYVFTITISIAAAGDALFSFVPPAWHQLQLTSEWNISLKLATEALFIVGLTILNIRGVRESILVLAPIFLIFLITHALFIVGGIIRHAPEIGTTAHEVAQGFREGMSPSGLGLAGMAILAARAYCLGGGTYTGIEAVSNGLPLMREPRVPNAKRTMLYLSLSLAFTATGLIICYLLWKIEPGKALEMVNGQLVMTDKTMNAKLVEIVSSGFPGAHIFSIVAIVSEGALLVVAAQAGFISGPRVLSNLAIDSWMPRHFSSLSERLTTRNGIVLMGFASLIALLYTKGGVDEIVVMYSINVFVTFSLSFFAMAKMWWGKRGEPNRRSRLALFVGSFVLCISILVFTVIEKFSAGGWVTLAVTGALVGLCHLVRRHYRAVSAYLAKLYADLGKVPAIPGAVAGELNTALPTAAVLVSNFNGVGIHTLLNVFRSFPAFFHNVVFLSIGVVDSGGFKGEEGVAELSAKTEEELRKYVGLAHNLGMAATFRFTIGTDPVDEAERLCLSVAKEFPRTIFFGGKVIFARERWYHRLLHNDMSMALQKRLQWAGKTVVILPARVR